MLSLSKLVKFNWVSHNHNLVEFGQVNTTFVAYFFVKKAWDSNIVMTNTINKINTNNWPNKHNNRLGFKVDQSENERTLQSESNNESKNGANECSGEENESCDNEERKRLKIMRGRSEYEGDFDNAMRRLQWGERQCGEKERRSEKEEQIEKNKRTRFKIL